MKVVQIVVIWWRKHPRLAKSRAFAENLSSKLYRSQCKMG